MLVHAPSGLGKNQADAAFIGDRLVELSGALSVVAGLNRTRTAEETGFRPKNDWGLAIPQSFFSEPSS
jgi:hypothetical protein